MSSKLAIFVVLFCVFAMVSGSLIKCYQCLNVEECKRDDSDMSQQQCGDGKSCVKFVNSDGKTEKKDCLRDNDKNAVHDSAGCSDKEGKAKRCICNTNLCNSADHFSWTTSTLIATVLAVLGGRQILT